MTVTRAEFIDAVLAEVEKQRPGIAVETPAARLALLALSVNEYGATSNFGATCNLLDTTEEEPGSWAFNSNGGDPVQNYATPAEGVLATASTLTNGRYDSALLVMAQLHTTPKQLNQVATAVLHQLAAGGWGAINLALVPQVQAAQSQYGALVVSGCADLSLSNASAPSSSPATSSTEEEPMFITKAADGGDFLVSGSRKAGVPNATALAALTAQGVKPIDPQLTPEEIDALATVVWGAI